MTQNLEAETAKADFTFKDLPRVAAESHQNGLDELTLWGWCGYLQPTADSAAREDLGTVQDLLDGVRQANAIGVDVAPFVSLRIIHNSKLARYGIKPSKQPARTIYHLPWRIYPEDETRLQPNLARLHGARRQSESGARM